MVASSTAQQLNTDRFHGMKARSIGPAGMSGRVTAIQAVTKNPQVIYVGAASGGLWKSKSGGVAWEPVFDSVEVASIGAIAIDQRNPDVVWVGTGEGNPRNSQTSGNGVYKSLDGGKHWIHLGLDKTRNIHRLILDPYNSDVAYIAAQGSAWADNPERGVFKTTDGGQTWQKVLHVNEKTGVADLVMDPTNPNKLIAAMWEYRRWPWFFKSGGPGSGLYITIDGGKSWKRLTDEDGIPKGELGRIGLAIAASSPEIVYALIESKKNALYRSEDGGMKWKKMSDTNIGNRPFYYAEIYVDPKNENRVYNLYSIVSMSEDGGKTFETLIPFSDIHGDHHAWYVHPENSNFLIDGNDGGAAISYDRGKSWRFIENLPLAQFYHINVDMETPYSVYGGLQDNGSWRGPAYVWRSGGIRNSYWNEVAFGDGFDVVPDHMNPRYVYAMSQGGNLFRTDMETGEQEFIRPAHPDNIRLRFNWNAGLAHDPFSMTTIYYGSQFLHKSTDRGETWQIISPDLTTNDTSKQKQQESGGLTYDVTNAENHTTIIAVAPSPVQEGVIWVGTDDGNVQLTQDGGTTWSNVVRNIKGVPESTWVPQIQPSTYNAGEAFVVFDNHRRNDWTPYVYQTTNFGKSWTRLVDEKKVWGYALSIVQDPLEPKLFFLGTEFGLYVSIDRGETWTKWKPGYPTVSTMDLAIQPNEGDLVIGTFGRAVYVLDDIRPLRAIAQKGTQLLESPLHVFDTPDAVLAEYLQAPGTRFTGEAEFSGENRPFGAMISYLVNPDSGSSKDTKAKKDKKEDKTGEDTSATKMDSVKIEILSSKNEIIRTLKRSAKAGINRTTWELDRKGERRPSQPKPEPGAREPGGPQVLPGKYKVRITYGKHADSTTMNVKFDPRIPIGQRDLLAKNALREELQQKLRTATEAADRLRDAKKRIEQIAALVKDRQDSTARKVKDRGKAIEDSMKVLTELITPKEVQGIRGDPSVLASRIGSATDYLNATWEPITETQRIVVRQATESLQKVTDAINAFFEHDWPLYKEAVDSARISLIEPYVPIRVEK
jgi:photosystem II stability/assembly factor-like uncharacterized protein